MTWDKKLGKGHPGFLLVRQWRCLWFWRQHCWKWLPRAVADVLACPSPAHRGRTHNSLGAQFSWDLGSTSLQIQPKVSFLFSPPDCSWMNQLNPFLFKSMNRFFSLQIIIWPKQKSVFYMMWHPGIHRLPLLPSTWSVFVSFRFAQKEYVLSFFSFFLSVSWLLHAPI